MGWGLDSREHKPPVSLRLIKKDDGGERFISNEPHNHPWWGRGSPSSAFNKNNNTCILYNAEYVF